MAGHSGRNVALPALMGLLILAITGMSNAQQTRSVRRHEKATLPRTAEEAAERFTRRLLQEEDDWRRANLGDEKTSDAVVISAELDEEYFDTEEIELALAPSEVAPAPELSESADYGPDDMELITGECEGPSDEASQYSKYPFYLGVGTSAYQIEGAASEDGRGESIWDVFAAESGKVVDNQDGSVATDFYHKYPEDIKLMQSLGLRNFRLSISWPRIFPAGSGRVNEEGLRFYSKLIDALLDACIEPMVTLYHWDLPQQLYDKYKGWTDGQVVDDFKEYAEVMFKELGGRVKYWSTFNEPYTFCMLGYGWGVHAPGRCDGCMEGGDVTVEPYLCAYNVVRAHAAVVESFRKNVKDGKLGINLNIDWAEPADYEDKMDVEATDRHYDLAVRIFADPLYKGDFPSSIRDMVPQVPEFTRTEREQLSEAKPDYFALNHYTSNFIKYDEYTPYPIQYQQVKRATNGTQIGPLADSPWLAMYPTGLRNVLNWVTDEYDAPPIFITENGVNVPGESEMPKDAMLQDDFRIQYFRRYLQEVENAIAEDGVDVRAYYAWTLLDNFEWAEGYTTRFGMVHVDFESEELTRTPKKSATWLPQQFGLIRRRRGSN